jgi:hypothetical protein
LSIVVWEQVKDLRCGSICGIPNAIHLVLPIEQRTLIPEEFAQLAAAAAAEYVCQLPCPDEEGMPERLRWQKDLEEGDELVCNCHMLHFEM